MKVSRSLLVLCIVGLAVGTAMAAEQAAQMSQATPKSESLTGPIKGTVGFTYMSDYIWHGMNLTKWLGGHSGTGATVANYGLGLDMAEMNPDYVGTLWFNYQNVYFTRYDDTDAHMAKTDYAASYSIPCPFMDGDWTFEYRAIDFREVALLRNVDADTQEASIQFAWNDGNFWNCVTGEDVGKKVLNPTLKYMYDYDAVNGGLLSLGLSHPFDLAKLSPDLDGLTLTPSPLLVVDNRYYGGLADGLSGPAFGNNSVSKTTKVAYTQLNLDLGANLSKMMGITSGKLMLNGGIGYVNSVESFLEDTLYSYAGISFNW